MELINSRYKILESLEQEHYYSQYIALDLTKKGEKVLLHLISDTQITRPFIEYCNSNFYEVSSYNQESIMSIYSYGIVEIMDDKPIEETIFFYTTEYVDSINLTDIDKPLEEYDLLDIYKQISRALDFLYYHGIVYKYIGVETVKLIKKENKITVKLLDIVSIHRMEIMKTYFHTLTCSFFAPELVCGMELGVYTDIYSLGSLLYYLLTLTLLDNSRVTSQNEDYLKDGSPKVKLFNMIQKMTSNDIDMRYMTIHECNDTIRNIYGLNKVIENLKDVDKINFKTSLIGRDQELRKILDVCEIREDRIRKFNKNIVLINGDKGIGKTRLINEVSHLIKWKKYKSFRVTINQQAEGFREIIGSVLKQFIKISSELYITKYGRELIKLVPELGSNRDIIPSQVLPNDQEVLRLYNRVANFMFDVSLIHPCVILIDDFHLADRSMIEFVDYLLNLNKIKKAPLLLILGYMDGHFYCDKNKDYINKWSIDNALSIKLSRLTLEETAKLVKHILGWHKEPLNFASRIMKDTEGTPSHIEEIIKELYSQKLLEVNYSTNYKGFAPIISVDDYNKIILSQNIDESILKQLQSLDNIAREILDVVSLFNTSISKDIISGMLETIKNDYDDYFSNLTQLRILNEKLDDWGYTYGFHNKDFKKNIYNNIDEDRRILLHIKASNILEELYIKEGRENKEELIYHLIQSDQKDKSINYCIESGIGMLKFFIYEQAYTFFKRAYELLEDDTDRRKLTVLIHLGDVSQNLSKNNDAIYYFNYAIKLANLQNIPKKSIDAKIKIGLLYSIRNEFDSALTYLNESIDEANKIKYVKGIMEAAYLLGRAYMQMRELQKMKAISEQYFDYAFVQNNLYYMGMFMGLRGIVEYFEENIVIALELFKESVEYLEKANKSEETARPINNIGVIYHDHFQDTHNARVYFQKALKISKQFRRTDGIITFGNNIADTYITEHDYYKAIDVLKKSIELALEYGEEISTLMVYSNLIVSYTNIGEYKQAYMYLLKANVIYKNRNINRKAIYLETYLEACAKLYMAMGAYNEALQIIKEFFEKFSHAEFLIQLRMRKLYYFAKYNSGELVEDKELIELINDYRETPYVRDKRMILLEGANYFINKLMISEAKCLLEEDIDLANTVNNDYFILKRKYVESFLLNKKQQIVALEDLILNKKLDQFKEIQWNVYAQLGSSYLQSRAYLRSINSFLNALDVIYVLFNTIPLEFKRLYLLKDDKFLVRINLFIIEKLINGDKSKDFLDIDDENYEKYKVKLLSDNNLEGFFDIVELQNILKNRKFYKLALEHYDKFNGTNITSIEQLVASFTDNNIKNLDLLLQLACRTTLASRGAIIEEEGHKIITSVGQSIPQDKINSILENVSSINKEVFSKSSLNPTRDFNREYFRNNTRGLICLPIYKENENGNNENVQENNRKNYNKFQKKIIGYLYLETDKALNNFSEETLKLCKNLLPLAGILLTNHYLTIFSSIDKMTGTYMRKYFEQVFDEEIEYAKEINQPLSIIMLDIDHFKNVNDIYGHQKGDIVLTEIGKIIRSNIRTTDYVGRYGGEEFIILLPGANKVDAYTIAEKVRNKVQSSKLLGSDAQLTISCGIASFPSDANKQIQIIERADQALYNAKENGRNRSVMWKKDIILGSKRVDKLAGIVTGNIIHDQRNVLVITEIIGLISRNSTIKEKIFTVLGRLIEILEAEEGILFTVEDNKIHKKYYRRRFIEDWVPPFIFNENLVKSVIINMEGKYIIDWESINSFDILTNTPNWKSVIIIPVVVNENVCGAIYLSVSIKEKEFDYNAYNLVKITSNIIGALLKTSR